MADLFLAPHNDDETLFGSFTIIRKRPYVVICLRSDKQQALGVSYETRERETEAALEQLGDPLWWQSEVLDTDPYPAEKLREHFHALNERLAPIEDVYAPAIEEGGHEQHNLIGQLAEEVWGQQVRPYLTYRRGYMRSRGREVVPEPGYAVMKMRALACYGSQIDLASTKPWFFDDTLREYVP